MISQKNVIKLAKKYKLMAERIERDYAMNLILDALTHCPSSKEKIFFKGGCCIHKCFSGLTEYTPTNEVSYFSERFSDDIDLTVAPELMDTKALESVFTEVGQYVKEKHGLAIGQFQFPIHENKKQGKRNCRGYLHFQGPMFQPQKGFGAPKLKLDLTSDETMPLPSKPVKIYDPYEQKELCAQCYTQEDLIAEKLRALMERSAARDLYDLSLLMLKSKDKNKMDLVLLGKAIEKKFALKKMDMDFDIQKFESRKKEFADSWVKSLKDQISSLPPFEKFWNKENITMILSFAQTCVSAYHMDRTHVDERSPAQKKVEARPEDLVKSSLVRQRVGRQQ